MSRVQIKHPYVISSEQVQGGSPVIDGTRIPVSTIIIWYKQGKDVDEIIEMYPELNAAQVYDALSYYHDHQKTLEKEISTLSDERHWQSKYPPGKAKPRR